jgi:Ni2+-binding GTPase involved in maturation of urease and hydrogenase
VTEKKHMPAQVRPVRKRADLLLIVKALLVPRVKHTSGEKEHQVGSSAPAKQKLNRPQQSQLSLDRLEATDLEDNLRADW